MNRILVVEDDKYLNKLICDQLLLHEFQVESVLDGEAAWKLLQDESSPIFDAVLVDMLLPKMMGAELLSKINESDRLHNLKKFAMSGIYKDAADLDQISSLHGLTNYWTKPFHLEALVAGITGKDLKEEKSPLKGLLSDTPIEKLYFKAYDLAFTGKLFLRSGDRERRVYFFNGHPVAIESSAVNESLGESLVELSYVTREQREEASTAMVLKKSFLGETLINLGYVTPDQLFKALRHHTQNLLLRSFFTRQGEYEFESLTELPSHLPLLEFNPFLLILQAQKKLISFDALSSLYQLRWEQFPVVQERMIQILTLLGLTPASLEKFSSLSGTQTFSIWLSPVATSEREECLRALYLMESIHLLAWSANAESSVDASQVRRMDFSSQYKSATPSIDDDSIMSEYMDMLNKNFYELFGLSQESTESEIEAAYRKIRFDKHPDRFEASLSGQTKRILDDILSRLDQAYQTLNNAEARRNYDARTAKKANDSAADSKRFLAAQDLFRQAIKLLESDQCKKAKELFERAYATWKPGIEYKIYAQFSEFKENFNPEAQSKAVSILQKMRETVYANSHSDRGFILLGHAHRSLSQLDAARDAYRRALLVNPEAEEAVNALATVATEDHKAKRTSRTLAGFRPYLFKTLGFVFLFSLGGVLFHFRKQFLNHDEQVSTLDPKVISDIFPAKEIRFKEKIAKIVVAAGQIDKVPEPVLRTKCHQMIDKIGMYGTRQIFLLDEKSGLRVICSYEKFQSFKR